MSDNYSEMSDDELWDRYHETSDFEKGQILISLHHRRSHEGEHNTAMAMAEQALEIFTRIDAVREISISNQLIGHSQMALKEYSGAIDSYGRAADFAVSCGSDSDTAWSENWIGDAYYRLQDYENAAKHYDSSEKIFDSIDEQRGVAMSAQDKADAYMRLGQYDKAIRAYERALENAISAEAPHQIYNAHFNITNAYVAIGDVEKAFEFAEKALAIGKTCSCRNCEVDAKALMGEVLALNNAIPEAVSYLEGARKVYYERNDSKMQLIVITELGMAELDRNPRKAREHLEHAITLIEMYPNRLREKTRANVGLGFLALNNGRFELASCHFAIAYEAASMRKNLDSERHRMLPMYLDSLISNKEPEVIIALLEKIESETMPWCVSEVVRHAYQAKALLMLNERESALATCTQGLHLVSTSGATAESRAILHEVHARLLKESDPRRANQAFHKAMAYYLETGRADLAEELGKESVIEPDTRIAAMAAHEDSRNTYDQVFGASDPISEQVQEHNAQIYSFPETPESGEA